MFEKCYVYFQSCALRSTDCTCTFADDADGGAGQVAKAISTTEILAGAAGAMTPLLIGGSILGIYKLKSGGGKGMDRSASRMSEGSKSQPPGYFSRRGEVICTL